MTTLKPNQLQAAILLATGKSACKVAEELEITPETISHWHGNDDFEALINHLKWEALNSARDNMRLLARDAVATVKDVMKNGKTDAARLKAAEVVLAHVGMTDPNTFLYGWGLK